MDKARFGIDVLLEKPWPVAGKRIGLITNASGVTAQGVPTWKALKNAPNARLVRLFGPEHGLEGGAVYMEAVQGSIHAPSGLPVVSLYGENAESLRPGMSTNVMRSFRPEVVPVTTALAMEYTVFDRWC